MKFTVELKTLVRMLKTVSKKMPWQKHADENVRLFACAARVFVEANGVVAGTEALVFLDGGCLVNCKTFLEVLKTFGKKPNLTFEIKRNCLHIGSFSMPFEDLVITKPPARFQIFPVTDLGVLEGGGPPRTGQRHSGGRQPSKSEQKFIRGKALDDPTLKELTAAASDCAKRLCSLSQSSPEMIAALKQAIYAVDHWPTPTQAVDVFYSVGAALVTTTECSEDIFSVHISGTLFNVGYTMITGTSKRTGPAPFQPICEAKLAEDAPSCWEAAFSAYGVGEWIDHVRDLFIDENPSDLLVRVENRSDAGSKN